VKLVECVPNFSEGRDHRVLDAIADAIRAVEGVSLLDIDPGAATNRTVFTFVGSPEAALEAAYRAIERAASLIDMTKHHGEHPRLGATDVCPFVPLQGVEMAECVALAKALGRRVGETLQIPVFLYEAAASTPERQNLATIRSGEYEGLAEKLRDPAWKPDFGPARFHAKAGAIVIGAREFLIAYNVNLNTTSKKLAHDIALDVREQGRLVRAADGSILKDASGNSVRKPGRFPHVKAVGWIIEEYRRAQVSINLTNFNATGLHTIFDAVCQAAAERGLRVTGSEIVGLVPLEAMLAAGRHYLRAQGASTGVPEARLIEIAAQSLGLHDVSPFNPSEKIIELRTRTTPRLVSMSLAGFSAEVAADSPAPGGGSVAAACGTMAAALTAMVAHLTYGKDEFRDRRPELESLALRAESLRTFFLRAVDEDTTAFDGVLAARRLPKRTPEEIAARDAAVERANEAATLVPLQVLERAVEVIELAAIAAERGNPASLSDAAVASAVGLAAAEGAYYNVLTNLSSGPGSVSAQPTRARADAAIGRARVAASHVAGPATARLG
jgi:glutamate formiminotransferase/formiminotetrahydrofolate cyclodeaminase